MEKLFGLLAASLAALQFFVCITAILQGRTRPHRAAWLIWFVLGGVIFTSQLAEGGKESLWITIMHMTGNLTVFLLSLKYGAGGFGKRDVGSLAAAGLGIVLWLITNQPVVALALAVGVDCIGAALTAKKAYDDPYSEAFTTWAFGTMAGISATFAVGSFQEPLLLVYPAYVAMNSAITAMTIVVRRRQLEVDETPEDDLLLDAEAEA